MPRIGMNPGRGKKTDYKPARITLAVLTYLPEEAGYFEHRLQSTRLCIESLAANTPEPFDLLVFDNGSCSKLVELLTSLRNEGKIDYLFLSSRNIGKIGALKFIFNTAPGEIVAYTDDDVFFLPGWLDEHLKILETYPKTGMVTGFYIRNHVGYGIESVKTFASQPNVAARRGMFLEREWEEHYINNMGRTWERYNEENAGLEDFELTYNNVTTYASAGHHQFVAPRQVILDVLPKEWGGQLMGQMREMDSAVDARGFLRLSTREPVTRLIGNIVSPEMAAEARKYGLEARGMNVESGKLKLFLRKVWKHTFTRFDKFIESLLYS